MESIFEFIGNVGFPIAISIILIYQLEDIRENYLVLTREFQEVINNNTKSIEMLNTTVEKLKDDMRLRVGEDK